MTYVNIQTSDRGWILEKMATELATRLPYIHYNGVLDQGADIQYYISYSAALKKISPIELAFFTHLEPDPATSERFFSAAQRMDYCVCHSSMYERIIRDAGVTNVTTIPPGVDLDALKPVVKIGVVGRTYHTGRKGERLVRCVMDVPGTEFHFTGEGWPGPALKIPENEMAEFYNSMDYILVPSLYEGGPMCVPEALACGVPVIAPHVGWVADFPHIPFKVGDVADLRRVLTDIVNQRQELRAATEAYTWDRWANLHDILFKSIVRKHGLIALSKSSSRKPQRQIRASLALHGSEQKSLGGPTVRVPAAAARMRKLGHDANAVFFPDVGVLKSEIIHGFNVWPPSSALSMARQVRSMGKKFVFSPIFLDLSERAFWGERLIKGLQGIASAEEIPAKLESLWSKYKVDQEGGRVSQEPEFGYNAMVREIFDLADHIVYLSDHERDSLSRLGAVARHATHIANPVDTTPYEMADGRLFKEFIGLEDFVVCLARVEPRKNQLLLLEALRGTGFPVVLIGGETNAEYSKLIDLYLGKDFHKVGRIDPNSPLIPSALAGARVVALPSWSEGSPLAALEGAAAGANMVLSNRSSERATFGELAQYCDPSSVASIRSAVLGAWDSSWTKASSQALKQHVKDNHSWERHISTTLSVYNQVLSERNSLRDADASVIEGRTGPEPISSVPYDSKYETVKHEVVVDVTTLANHKGRPTGIARTEAAISQELGQLDSAIITFIAYSDEQKRFVPIDRAAVVNKRVGEYRCFEEIAKTPLALPRGGRLFVCGSAWLQSKNYPRAINDLASAHNLDLTIFVHDVIPLLRPHWFPPNYADRFRLNLKYMLANAENVLCNSENTLNDIIRVALDLNMPTPNLAVVKLGDNLPTGQVQATIREDLRLLAREPGFVLAVGAIHIRKNYGLLAETWAGLKSALGSNCPKLVIVGGVAWNGSDIARSLLEDPRLAGTVVLEDDIDDLALQWLYTQARLTVYPSFYEGWGLPVAESLANGKICLASDKASIPEIAPDVTDLLDPFDQPLWVSRLLKYLTNPAACIEREAEIRAKYKAQPWSDVALNILRLITDHQSPQRRITGYLPGTEMKITEDAPASLLRAVGWHQKESWGTWSAASEASLEIFLAVFPKNTAALRVECQVFNPGNICMWCDVHVNGQLIGRIMNFDSAPVIHALPLSSIILDRRQKFTVTFKPGKQSQLSDGRLVGFGLNKVALINCDQMPIAFKDLGAYSEWVKTGDYLDLTLQGAEWIDRDSSTQLRRFWGRSAAENETLALKIPLDPSAHESGSLRIVCRAVASEASPQVVFVRLASGEILTRLEFNDDEIHVSEINLQRERFGFLSPVALEIVCPIANSPMEIGLGADKERFGLGIFGVLSGDGALWSTIPTAPPTSRVPLGLSFGSLFTNDMPSMSEFLLASTWHLGKHDGRHINGPVGHFLLPTSWISTKEEFWIGVRTHGAGAKTASQCQVEIWHGPTRLVVEDMTAGEHRWIEVKAAGSLRPAQPYQSFSIRCSATVRVADGIHSWQEGIFVSKLAFDAAMLSAEVELPDMELFGLSGSDIEEEIRPAGAPSAHLNTLGRNRALDTKAEAEAEVDAAMRRGSVHMTAQAWLQAAEAFEEVLLRRPEAEGVWVQYGHAMKEAGRHGDAAYSYERALGLAPRNVDTMLHLAHLRLRAEDVNGAARQFYSIVRTAPESREAGEARSVLVNLKRAESVTQAISSADIANLERRWSEAAVRYAEALRLSPERAAIWVQFGHALKEAGRKMEALTAYMEAANLRNEHTDALLHMTALAEELELCVCDCQGVITLM